MTTEPIIAVTGATGALGGAVARTLAGAGVRTRLLVRDRARAPRLPGAETAAFDFAHASAAQLAGVSALLMVSAHEGPERPAQHRAVIEAAAEAGVGGGTRRLHELRGRDAGRRLHARA